MKDGDKWRRKGGRGIRQRMDEGSKEEEEEGMEDGRRRMEGGRGGEKRNDFVFNNSFIFSNILALRLILKRKR